jgi:hypothetical protein
MNLSIRIYDIYHEYEAPIDGIIDWDPVMDAKSRDPVP